MKALIVVALFCTVNLARAEAPQSHLEAAAAAAATAAAKNRISPTTVRPEKVSQCINERLNLAKGRTSSSVSAPIPSTTLAY